MEKLNDFQKLEIFYNEYITKIAELISSFDSLDMYQQNLLYDNLLHSGLLSFTETFEYHDYVIDNDQNSILGARITSGSGVCRHMGANQRDVFNKLGYQTVDITCFTKYPKTFKNHPVLYILAQIYFGSQFPYDKHAIVGLYKDNEQLIVCPTGSLTGIPKSQKIIRMEQLEFPHEQANEYMISRLDNVIQHPNEYKKYLELLKLPSYLKSKTAQELQQIFIDTEMLLSKNYDQLKDWKKENLDLMNEIRILDERLSTYSDQVTRRLKR